MRLTVQMIGLILLGICPAGLLANDAVSPDKTLSSAAELSPMPLKPPSPANRDKNDKPLGGSSLVTVGGSLAVVLGIFFLVVWLLRRASPASLVGLPAEVFESLGRASIVGRQHVQLLRCGNKLLLVSISAAGDGARTLAEITEPAEVERLAGLCRQARHVKLAASVRPVVQQAENRNA